MGMKSSIFNFMGERGFWRVVGFSYDFYEGWWWAMRCVVVREDTAYRSGTRWELELHCLRYRVLTLMLGWVQSTSHILFAVPSLDWYLGYIHVNSAVLVLWAWVSRAISTRIRQWSLRMLDAWWQSRNAIATPISSLIKKIRRIQSKCTTRIPRSWIMTCIENICDTN